MLDLEKKEKLEKTLKIISILAIISCCVLLIPQVRAFIVQIAEKSLGRELRNHDKWMNLMLRYSLFAIMCFSIILLFTVKNIQNFMERHRIYKESIFIFTSIGIVIISIIVIIVMYAKCRTLWLDEAMLAESIVSRDWSELLIPPLSNNQSAPVLYVIVVKLIGSIFGYSEFSLRIFSFFAFVGLLICEVVFMKKALVFSNYHVAFIVVVSALLPSYIWYSNELKPYMSDAFFVVLTFLLYFYYTQDKIKLPMLTTLYVLIMGFSTPAIFFIGGILFSEFLAAVLKKNKKQTLFVFILGTIVLAVFCLYYYWWMLPISEFMKTYWVDNTIRLENIRELRSIFSAGVGHSDSSFVLFFVPFALLGIFSLIKLRNKIAYSVAVSLFFVFFASAIGYWPLSGRLWLFLPAILLIFTPVGIDFVRDKIKHGEFTNAIKFIVFSATVIYLSVNCLGYAGDKMYFIEQEINPLINYVQRNIREDEKLYVYPMARFAFEFKNGYAVTKIGNVDNDNIIYGIDRNEWNESSLGDELRLILENERSYLIFQHYWEGIDKGLDVLRNYGTLTEAMNVYDTPLYYFEKYVNK